MKDETLLSSEKKLMLTHSFCQTASPTCDKKVSLEGKAFSLVDECFFSSKNK